MTDSQLIKNLTILHAYFCHLIETDQVNFAEELCEISWEHEKEIKRRKISQLEIEDYI